MPSCTRVLSSNLTASFNRATMTGPPDQPIASGYDERVPRRRSQPIPSMIAKRKREDLAEVCHVFNSPDSPDPIEHVARCKRKQPSRLTDSQSSSRTHLRARHPPVHSPVASAEHHFHPLPADNHFTSFEDGQYEHGLTPATSRGWMRQQDFAQEKADEEMLDCMSDVSFSLGRSTGSGEEGLDDTDIPEEKDLPDPPDKSPSLPVPVMDVAQDPSQTESREPSRWRARCSTLTEEDRKQSNVPTQGSFVPIWSLKSLGSQKPGTAARMDIHNLNDLIERITLAGEDIDTKASLGRTEVEGIVRDDLEQSVRSRSESSRTAESSLLTMVNTVFDFD